MKSFEHKEYLYLLLCFILIISNCYSYDKVECFNRNEVDVNHSINSFFEKMKEDREKRKNKYESCRYDQECEIWVSPKIDIYKLEYKLHDYIYNYSDNILIEDDSGNLIKVMKLDLSDFFRDLNAKVVEGVEVGSLIDHSVINHRGTHLELYNLDIFLIKKDVLLVNVKPLTNIIQGYHYRLDIDLLKVPSYDGLSEKRYYPLNQCGEVINFNEYEISTNLVLGR